MRASAVFLSLIAAVAAHPQPVTTCGNNNSVHCCNSQNAQKLLKGGLISGNDLSGLLGNCEDITAAVAGGAVPFNTACNQQPVCCSQVEQNVSENLSRKKDTGHNTKRVTGPCQPWLQPHQPVNRFC